MHFKVCSLMVLLGSALLANATSINLLKANLGKDRLHQPPVQPEIAHPLKKETCEQIFHTLNKPKLLKGLKITCKEGKVDMARGKMILLESKEVIQEEIFSQGLQEAAGMLEVARCRGGNPQAL
ncbi:hypothetical protein K493DRAFT_320138, partial [Basidiobolus meristosporus CBS 931.73]